MKYLTLLAFAVLSFCIVSCEPRIDLQAVERELVQVEQVSTELENYKQQVLQYLDAGIITIEKADAMLREMRPYEEELGKLQQELLKLKEKALKQQEESY